MKKLLIFLLIVTPIFIFSQQAVADIEIVHFNSTATYSSGSDVSLHINPKGIYNRTSNIFSLYLSDVNGNFNGNEILLSSVNQFYTPLINGTLPAGLVSGTYNLRVVATQGYLSMNNPDPDENTFEQDNIVYGEVESADISININNQEVNSNLTIQSSLQNSEIFFNCLGTNEVNPNLGSLVQSLGSTTSGLGASNAIIFDSEAENFNILLIDVINDQETTLEDIVSVGPNTYLFNIPDNLAIGTYNFEIEEVFDNNLHNVSSFSLLWHSNTPSLNPISNNELCVGEIYNFVIDSDYKNGIGRNYSGSYYTIDWGDGSETQYYTHAYILAYNSLYFSDLIDNNYFSHTFVGAACNANSQDSSVYTVQKELYNILDCSNYSVNGGGLTTDVSTSEPPVAAISHDDQFCLDPSNQNSLIILNQTIPGQYSSGDDCLNDAVYTWQYQTPASSVWITISSFLPAYQWISDYNSDGLSDLVIPYSALDGSPGCWNFRLEAVNGNGLQCEFSDLAEGTVEVLQLPDVNFNIQDINGNTVEEICPSGSVTLLNLTDMSDLLCQDLNYEWEINPINPPDLVNYISYTDSTNSFSENPIVVFNEPGEYEITLTVTNGNCEPQSFTLPFTVTGTPGVTLGVNTDNEEVCVQNISLQNSYVVDFSQNFTPQYTSEPFAPSSYLWEISGDNITSNDYSFINGTDSESPFPIIEFYSFECYNISISVDSTCATSSNDSFVLSITGIPDVNFQFQNETGDVVSQACPGQTIDFTNLTSFEGSGCQDIVYTWIINGTNQFIYQNGNNNSQTPSVSFNDPGIYEVSLLVNNGICATDIITQSITIEGPPSVDINVNGSDSDQICLLNSNLPYTIDFSSTYIPSYSDGIFSPNSYLWEISGDGVTAADYTFINSSDSPFPVIQFNSFKDFNITSTVEGNCQVSSSDQFVLALNQIPEITDLNISQTVCSGESTEEIIFQSNVDETDYSWTLINADTYLSGYDQQGTGDFSIQNIINSNDISGQIEFSVTPFTSDCQGTPQTFTITVNPEPSINNISEEICSGSGISITPTSGTIPQGTTYTWDTPTSSPVGAITGGTSGTDASLIFDSELLNLTNSPATLTYTVTPKTTNDCFGDTFNVSVTVDPLGQVTNPGDQEFCNNDNIVIDFSTVNTGGDTTFSWTNSNSAIGLSNSGTGNINVTATNTGNDPIISTVTVTPSFEGCEGTPQTFTITVNPTPQLNDPDDQIIVTGEATQAVNLSSTVSGVTYNWSASEPTGDLIGLSQTNGTSNQIPSEILINNTPAPLVLTYTITPVLDGVDCSAVIEEYTVTINPLVTMNPVGNQVVCNGDEVNIDFDSANSGGTTTYSWENDTPGIGLGLSGSGDLPVFTAINNGIFPVVATIIVIPTFENGGVSTDGDPQTFTITVNPSAQVNEVENQTLCNSDQTSEINFSTLLDSTNQTGITTYSWVNDTPGIGLAASGSGDIASFVAVNNSSLAVTATIIVTPIYTNEDKNCFGPVESFTITVNPKPNISDSLHVICSGEALDGASFDDSDILPVGTTYSWGNPVISPPGTITGNSSGSVSPFFTSSILNNISNAPATATYNVTPTSADGCVGDSFSIIITVNPTGQVNEIDSQILCNSDLSDTIVFTTENSGGTTTYSWVNDTPGIGLADSGSGDINSFNAINNSTEPITATIQVTPSFEGCEGTPQTFTITVNPTATMNDPQDMVVCNAEITSVVEFTTNTGVITTYSWTNDTPEIGLAAAGSGDLPSFTAINNGTEAIVANIQVTPQFTENSDCDAVSQSFTITVNPSAQVNEVENQILCNGDQLLLEFTTQNNLGNTTFNWISDIDFGTGLTGNGNLESVVVNNGINPITATVTIFPSIDILGEICPGQAEIFTVTVIGNIVDQAEVSNYNGYEISCYNENDGFINLNPIGGSPNQINEQYNYSWTGPNNFSSSEQNISNLEPGIYNLTISDSLNCEFNFQYEINEPSLLEILVIEQSDVQCNNVSDGFISVTGIGGVFPYSYEWKKDGIFFSNDQNISNLETGVYELILNDSNSCGEITQIFEINQPDPIEISLENAVNILCYGENTGEISIAVSGGTPEQISSDLVQYNYSWIGPNGFLSSSQNIQNLYAGTYFVTVTDSLGCEENFELELTQPNDLIIEYSTTNNSCFESNDSSITLDIQGGVEPYQIFWSNFANGEIISNLSAGIYDVTVIDSNDCEESISIEILEAPIFDINPIVSNISCIGENDGSINLNISGGVAPVLVTWDDDPSAGADRNNLGPGTYNVSIQDSSENNCSINQQFIIIEPLELTLDAIIQNAIECDNASSGSIDLIVIGGTSPYTFNWSNGEVTEDLNNIPPGNYSISVTDSMGCEAITQFEVTRPGSIDTNLDIYYSGCEGGDPAQITTLQVTGGVPPYNISWSDGIISGDNNETMTTSQNGTYVANITDSIGCIDQIIFDVNLFEIGEPQFTYESNGLNLCDSIGINDIIQFTNQSDGDYTNLIWNFGDGTPIIEGVESPQHAYSYEGTYEISLTVEYPYGCSLVFYETINVSKGYGLVLPNTFTPNGDGINDTIRPWFKCMSSVEVSIYDTFGSLLYVESSTDEIYGWDGLINGKPAENGNYIIVVRAVSLYGEEIELNGPVTLVR